MINYSKYVCVKPSEGAYLECLVKCVYANHREMIIAERLLLYMIKKSEYDTGWKFNLYKNTSGQIEVAYKTLKISRSKYYHSIKSLKESGCIALMPGGDFYRFSVVINWMLRNNLKNRK